MKKINKIIIGTHNDGKFKEICDLLPKNIVKISHKDLNLVSPDETGNTFEENSKIKAEYFAKKSDLIAISDDSGLIIDLLSGAPGIYSSRWAGPTNDFNFAIEKIYNDEEVWSTSDCTHKEIVDFLEQMNSKQFKEIENFFSTMPKLSHEVEITNPKTKVKSTVVLEGLSSFFG